MISVRPASRSDRADLAQIREQALDQGDIDPSVLDTAARTAPDVFHTDTVPSALFACEHPHVLVAERGERSIGWAVVYTEVSPVAFVFVGDSNLASQVDERLVEQARAVAEDGGIDSLLVIVFRAPRE